MNIQIWSSSQQQGPFTVEEVRHHVESGLFSPKDFARMEGQGEWEPLPEFLERISRPAPAPAQSTVETGTTEARLHPTASAVRSLVQTVIEKTSITTRLTQKQAVHHKLAWVELRQADHRIGKKAYEEGGLLPGQGELLAQLADLQQRIAALPGKEASQLAASFLEKTKAAVKKTAQIAKVKALQLQQSHLLTELGHKLRETPPSEALWTAVVQSEMEAAQAIREQMTALNAEMNHLAAKTYPWARQPLLVISLLLAVALPLAFILCWQADAHAPAFATNKLTKSSQLRFDGETKWLAQNAPGDASVGLTMIRRAADDGDARAMTDLGQASETGDGLARNLPEAVKWYQRAIKKRDGVACYNLANCYHTGMGLKMNVSQASKLFVQARCWCLEQAAQNDGPAMECLGHLYSDGLGVQADRGMGADWYLKACKAGCADAFGHLGWCYERGLGVEQNLDTAVQLYQMAIPMGSLFAMDRLADCLICGRGVWMSYPGACKLFQIAAGRGDVYAMTKMGEFDSQHIEPAKALAWSFKAAEAGSARAMLDLGRRYDNGSDVGKNLETALGWYQKAAEAGDAEGMRDLAICYEDGTGVGKNLTQAGQWYQKALAAGNPDAKEDLQHLGDGTRVQRQNDKFHAMMQDSISDARESVLGAIFQMGVSQMANQPSQPSEYDEKLREKQADQIREENKEQENRRDAESDQ